MRYLYDSYENLAARIKSENRTIAVYGAGMIGQILIPYIIEKFDLYENLLFYIDRDHRKQGNRIQIGQCEYSVQRPERLKELKENTVLLITNSNFSPIVDMLDNMEELNHMEGYIIPILQVLNTYGDKEKIVTRISKEQLIPKKIHYCWFSHNPMPDYLKKCIDSWHKYCPDYEIICWDEDNYDVRKNLYMKQAYEAKKWGFVPDIARLDILYEHGGIYLDTDVELIRNLDDLLYQPAFAGVEKWGNINMGGCSGAMPHHPVIRRLLDYRIDEKFCMEDGSLNLTTCGYYETKPLIDLGMKPDNTMQRLNDFTVYPSDFFHPYDYMSGETHKTENTYSVHHFNGGWLDKNSISERKNSMELYKHMLDRMQVSKTNELD